MTQLDLTGVKAAIFVFVMDDCPICHDYLPVLTERVAAHSRAGFVVCDGSCPVTARQIPVLIYDVTSGDPQLQALISSYAITATPTTLLLANNSAGSCKLEGYLTPGQLDQVLAMAQEIAR